MDLILRSYETLRSRDVPESGRSKHQCRVAVRKAAYHTRPSANLTHDALQRIVRANLSPVLPWKVIIGKRFIGTLTDSLGGLTQLHTLKLIGNGPGFCLASARSSWAWIALSIAETSLSLPCGTTEKTFL